MNKEIAELEEVVTNHQRYYYIDNNPKLSDGAFDALYNKLLKLEEEAGNVNPWSPTLKVGSDLSSELPEVKHAHPILSLNKVHEVQDLIKWIRKNDTQISIEPKFDGASLVLYYNNGVLDKAVTRGNGSIGNDIIDNARTIYNIPLQISHTEPTIIRGEVVMSKDKFEEYNKKHGNKYSNSRNLTAGLLRHKTSSKMSDAPLHFMAYDVSYYDIDTDYHDPYYDNDDTYYDRLQFLINNFFSTPNVTFFTTDALDITLEKKVAQLERDREDDEFEWDGLVIKINDMVIRSEMGSTSHHPKWAMAFKFKAMKTATVLNGITLQVGREGRVTPVAELEPVELAGSIIARATLHNQDYINKLGLRIGDTVEISKRGDVIPAVEKVITHKEDSVDYIMDNYCPTCTTPLVSIGAHTYCQNADCQSRVDGQLIHFIGKKGLDIKGVGEELIKYLIEEWRIKDIAELYTFDYNKLNGQPGFGNAKIKNIIDGLEESKKKGLKETLPALGLNMLSHSVTDKLIANGYNSIDKILQLSVNDFSSIDGIGDIIAHRIINHLHSPKTIRLITSLKTIGFSFYTEIVVQTSAALAGQIWCVTGSFTSYKPRSLAEDIIKNKGGKVTSSVTKNTTHLLCGEKAGSKLKKAQQLGTIIVDENSFKTLLEKL